METVQTSQLIISKKDLVDRLLPASLWVTAIFLGALHALAAAVNHSMNADGISYLDIGDAYVRGDWNTAVSAVWSPFYSWILGSVMVLVNPSTAWEFPLVHIVNFAVYLLALVCFTFFWRQLSRLRKTRLVLARQNRIGLPDWAWVALGYLLFIWTSLFLIEIWSVTPDMLMATFVYLAAGLVISIHLGEGTWVRLILLGVVLGFGYLAKTIMWPIGLVFVGSALLSLDNFRKDWPKALIALVVFLTISGAFIAIISLAKGRFTYGDAGSLTYVRHVNGIPYPHWQGGPEGLGMPIHPTRQILDSPPIYEFGNPIGGTYPVSLDPYYWYEGVEYNFDLRQQLQALMQSGLFFFDLFFRQLGVLIASLLVMFILGWQKPQSISTWARNWALTFPAIAALILYAPVLVEGRYIAVFVTLLLGILLVNTSLSDRPSTRRLLSSLSVISVTFLLFLIVVANLEGFADLTTGLEDGATQAESYRSPSWPGEVTRELQLSGLQAGDPVGVIGYAFDSYWARLGRYKIVAEMLDSDAEPFWTGDQTLKAKVLSAFESTGVKAVVAEHVPAYANLNDWHQVADTNYYIYLFNS